MRQRRRLNVLAGICLSLTVLAPSLVNVLHEDRKGRDTTAATGVARLAADQRVAVATALASGPPGQRVERKIRRSRKGSSSVSKPAPGPPVVAVIDGGVDLAHSGLSGHLWTNRAEIAGNGRDDDSDGIVDDVHGASLLTKTGDTHDDGGHGTHVAGIVAATAPGAEIMALKAGSGERIDIAAATAAVYYAVGHGARVINLSWAFLNDDPVLAQALDYASAHNVLVVAAAGNFGTDNDVRPVYPASYGSDTLVSVAATCDGHSVASFSDYGKRSVAIAAPGCDIMSALPGGGYGTLSGTSMAAPAVAGAAAALMQSRPGASAREVERALLGGARPDGALTDRVATGASLNVAGARAALASPDRTAPAAPSELSPGRSFATQQDPNYFYRDVTFSWTPSPALDLAGYRLVVDGTPVAATGPGETSTVVRIAPGDHTWTVAAYDRSGNESTTS